MYDDWGDNILNLNYLNVSEKLALLVLRTCKAILAILLIFYIMGAKFLLLENMFKGPFTY